MDNLVSGHSVFPGTPLEMGNSLPHRLFCSSQSTCPAVWEWEQPIPVPCVLVQVVRKKSVVFTEVPARIEMCVHQLKDLASFFLPSFHQEGA